MNDRDIFNEVFKNYGGIIDVHDLGKDWQIFETIFERVLKQIKSAYPNAPDIYINFIKSLRLNAAVSIKEEKYYIGINIGLYFIFIDVFKKILCNKKLYTNLGDNSKESELKSTINVLIDNGCVCYYHDKLNYKDPIDKERTLYAGCFTMMAIQFIIYHEVCHIIHGHVKYKFNNLKNSNCWDEIPELMNFDLLENSFDQSLEIDCDSFATLSYFRKFSSLVKDTDKQPSVFNLIFKDGKSFLKCWIYTIYPMFRILGYHPDWTVYKKQSHPPPIIRFSNSFRILLGLLIKDGYLDDDFDLFEDAHKYILEAEIAFSEVTYHEFDVKIIIDIQTKNDEYVDFLWDVLKESFNILSPFSYLKKE